MEVVAVERELGSGQGDIMTRTPNSICDRAWEKGPCRAFKKNRVITSVGKSRL